MPLDFLPLPDGLKLKAYGSLGNVWIEKTDVFDLPRNDWWYWQIGLVVTSFRSGLDLTFAYTDTNIEAEHCGFTRACEGRFFVSVTKVFLTALFRRRSSAHTNFTDRSPIDPFSARRRSSR